MTANTSARPVDLSRPCWHCEHYLGLDGTGAHAVCVSHGTTHIQAQPDTGCVFWLRAPGADDSGRPPKGYRGGDAGVGWRDQIPPHLLG